LFGYRLEALLGRGGMGVVYKAYDPRLKRYVALKLIAPDLSEDERFRERFLAESELAASLEHPNVVPIYDAFDADGRLAIAMRYVEGTDLKQLLQTERVLDPERAVTICAQVAAALDAAHQRGLVHRDVKPSNVLLDENEHVYLADFGLSRRLADPGVPEGGSFSVGTPAYAAPEQIEGGEVDGRADVYSLGCLFYECLSGEMPFKRDSELAVLWAHVQEEPPVLPGLEEVIPTALAKDPDERYATCGELVVAAREALGLHQPVTIRDRKALILTAAGVAVVAAAVLAGVLLSQGGGPGKASTKPTLTPKVDSLQRIDPKTNKLVATIGGVGSNPNAIAVGAGSVWVGSLDDGTVSRVDPETNEIQKAINTGAPDAIVVRDASVLVANQFGSLSSIDPASMIVTTQIERGPGFGYGSLALGEGALWGLWILGGGLDRINHGSAVVKTLTDLGLDPFALAAGQGAVWVLDSALRRVVRVDPATNRVVERLRLRFDPGGIAVGGGSVWVTDPRGGSVIRIDPRSKRVVGSTRVGRDPVAIVSGGESLWVANYNDGTVARIDSHNASVVKTIRVGPHPATLATGSGGVWVAVRAA
jgi:DNA-binding beta-propeller fold protein YncE/predicted Ser/Thr protein kinase